MMGEPSQVGRAEFVAQECRERPAVEGDRAIRREFLLDRQARELVPEDHPVGLGAQHAGSQTLVQRLQISVTDRLEQPDLRPLRNDGDSVQELAGGRAEPRDPRRAPHPGPLPARRWSRPPVPR